MADPLDDLLLLRVDRRLELRAAGSLPGDRARTDAIGDVEVQQDRRDEQQQEQLAAVIDDQERAEQSRPSAGPARLRSALGSWISSQSRRHGEVRGDHPSQLFTRVDGELLIDVAKVVLDRLRAEEQRRRGFACRLAAGEQDRDL